MRTVLDANRVPNSSPVSRSVKSTPLPEISSRLNHSNRGLGRENLPVLLGPFGRRTDFRAQMTVAAFAGQRSVANQIRIQVPLRRMTAGAGHTSVDPIESKSGVPIVIEGQFPPSCGGMTPIAPT